MRLNAGESLGRYVIEGVIGQGGMGSVYRAHDTRLQRTVALKILTSDGEPSSGLSTTGGSARILREARSAARLEHPNVVSIYDVDEVTNGEHAGLAYLAMEFVQGRPLREYVGDSGIPIKVRVGWLADIARALSAAHARDLVHRDVKPENVMVGADAAAKVLDFGIARQLRSHDGNTSRLGPALEGESSDYPASSMASDQAAAHATTMTGDGVVWGTPYYMSPEQMRGERIDARSDQFSWGVLAYELLTGTPPWGTQQSPVQLVASVLGTTPVRLDAANPEVPRWLADVVERTMAKSPENRFASMRDIDVALRSMEAENQSAPDPRESVVPQGRHARGFWLGVGLGLMGLSTAATIVVTRSSGIHPTGALPDSTAISSAGCASHLACSKSEGQPALCVARACVRIASEDCHVSADPPALESEETVWLGSMYPQTGPLSWMGQLNERGTDLARQDFAEAAAALKSGGAMHPLALVSCDEASDPERAAAHLVNDLHVPAVLGFTRADTLLHLASTQFIPHHVLTLSTLTPNPLITRIPRPAGETPLVWRSGFSLTQDASALALFAEHVIEPQLRNEGVQQTRIILLRPKSAALLSFSEDLFRALHFNGKSALTNGSNFQEVIIDTEAPALEAEYDSVASKLIQAAPNIVIYSGGGERVQHAVEALERSAPRLRIRPRYVSTLDLSGAIVAFVGTDRELRHRVFGMTLPSETDVNARFTLHYNGVYQTSLTRDGAPSTTYDGFYLLAYATLALGDRPVTGPNLASAMSRLVPPGAPIEVGPGAIFEAFTKLRAGESIDLRGTGGPLDLDLQTGENSTDLAIECMAADKDGRATGGVESGLVYSAKTGTLTGSMHCP